MSSSSKLFHCLLLVIFTLALAQPPKVVNITTTPPANTTPPPVVTTAKPVRHVHHKFNGEVQPYEICLDGANNSFVSYNPKVGDFGTKNFTVAIWIQTNDTLPLYDIVGNRNASGQGNYFSMRMSGTNPALPPGQVIVELDQNATGFNYANLTSNRTGLNDGNWHYLVFVRNGLNLNLYVDGTLDKTIMTPGIANITNPEDFKIGRSVEAVAGPRFSPVACYAELRVYRRALSPVQIGKLFAVQGTIY